MKSQSYSSAPALLWHCFVLFLKFIYFIFWLRWVVIAVLGLSVVAVSRGYSSLVGCGLLVAEHRL